MFTRVSSISVAKMRGKFSFVKMTISVGDSILSEAARLEYKYSAVRVVK